MAEIKTLKQGETQVLPRTVANAVNTDSGLSVQAELDALKESTPDVSAQINEHNVAEDAHANRFANYLPLSGGTMTGELVIGNEKDIDGKLCNTIGFSKTPDLVLAAASSHYDSGPSRDSENESVIMIGVKDYDDTYVTQFVLSGPNDPIIAMGCSNNEISIDYNSIDFRTTNIKFNATIIETSSNYTPEYSKSVVNKKYVDDQIAAIPTPDVSAQIEAHNTSDAAHANMHWLTADDEMLSSIDPDGSIDADTLESHPASDFVLKSELSSLVPAPDLTNYYTKAQVDEKITQIQQLIDQAAALVDEINGLKHLISKKKGDQIYGMARLFR